MAVVTETATVVVAPPTPVKVSVQLPWPTPVAVNVAVSPDVVLLKVTMLAAQPLVAEIAPPLLAWESVVVCA